MLFPLPIIALAISQTLGYAILFYTFIALGESWSEQRGWSMPLINGALTAALAAQALTAPLFGRFIDQGMAGTLLPVGLAAGSMLLASIAWVEAIWWFYAAWILMGFCWSASLYDTCFSYLIQTRGRKARQAITAVTLVAGFASTLSYPFNRWMAAQGNWELSIFLQAGFGLLIMVPLAWYGTRKRVHPDLNAQNSKATVTSQSPTIANTPLLLFTVGISLLVLAHFGLLPSLFPLFNEVGLNNLQATVLASLIGPMQVVGRIALMFSPTGIPMIRVTYVCAASMIAAFLVLFSLSWLAVSVIPIICACLVFVLLDGGAIGVLSISKPLSLAESFGKDNIGTLSGVVALPSGLAVAIGPFLLSYFAETFGFPAMLGFVVIILMAALLALVASQQLLKE